MRGVQWSGCGLLFRPGGAGARPPVRGAVVGRGCAAAALTLRSRLRAEDGLWQGQAARPELPKTLRENTQVVVLVYLFFS